MNEKLIKMIEEVANEKLSKLSSIRDLKELDFWDSIARVQLILSIEEEIGRSLEKDELSSISSINTLKNLID